MTNRVNHITVFEHQTLKVGQQFGKVTFNEKHLFKLATFYGEKGVPYFKLINKGVQFNQYVGVLQMGQLTIEILPKVDKESRDGDKTDWQSILIEMLRTVGTFNVTAPSTASLKLKSNYILDLYFELFIKEVEYLFKKGLFKSYRKTQGNSLALKGNIVFDKHIQQNIVHQERFYIKHTTYDKEHLLHQIILQTLQLLQAVNANVSLNSRIGNLLLNFPEMKTIKITEALFKKVIFNRKNKDYKEAIEIAKLLQLNYHPDLSNGQNNVLALMFDMNQLWEKYVLVMLRRYAYEKYPDYIIKGQASKPFWGSNSLKPDIVINYKNDEDKDESIIIDTKWKLPGSYSASVSDLRQMYAYGRFWNAKKVMLLYPGDNKNNEFKQFENSNDPIHHECKLGFVSVLSEDSKLDPNIGEKIMKQVELC